MSDFEAKHYKYQEHPRFWPREFFGQDLHYDTVDSPEALDEAIALGAYLQQQGYDPIPLGEFDTLVLKIGWYFSTWEHGSEKDKDAKDRAPEREFTFALKISRRALSVLGIRDRLAPNYSEVGKHTGLIIKTIREFIKEAVNARIP